MNVFSHLNEQIWPQFRKDPSASVRLPFDTISGQQIFVYQYLTDDLLRLGRKPIPMQASRQILKASLEAIADLHDWDVVHLGQADQLSSHSVS